MNEPAPSIPARRAPARAAWAVVVAAACAVTGSVPAAAEPPVAPAPEAVILDPRVTPVSLADDAGAGGVRPATPLGGSPAAAVPRPLPDWRLLAALAAAFAAVATYRVFTGRRTVVLPPDVFEVLGEAALGGQQSVRVVRFGPRTLLIGVSSAGCQTLAELNDPQATDRVVAACRGTQPQGRGGRRGSERPAAEARA